MCVFRALCLITWSWSIFNYIVIIWRESTSVESNGPAICVTLWDRNSCRSCTCFPIKSFSRSNLNDLIESNQSIINSAHTPFPIYMYTHTVVYCWTSRNHVGIHVILGDVYTISYRCNCDGSIELLPIYKHDKNSFLYTCMCKKKYTNSTEITFENICISDRQHVDCRRESIIMVYSSMNMSFSWHNDMAMNDMDYT